jgi:hypothetical protein
MRSHLKAYLRTASYEDVSGPLRAKMLWELQQIMAEISSDEPGEVRPPTPVSRFAAHGKRLAGERPTAQGRQEPSLPVLTTSSSGSYTECSRQQAARMYRTACRTGVESVWEGCA